MTPAQSLDAFGWSIDVPAALLLVFAILIAAVMWQANLGQRWAEAFQDDSGKISFGRMAIFFTFAAMTWHLIFTTMNVVKKGDDLDALFPFYLAYGLIWSGAKAADKLLDVLKLRFGGGVDRPQAEVARQ